MIKHITLFVYPLCVFCILVAPSHAIETEALLDSIVNVKQAQIEKINDLNIDAVMFERRTNSKGEIKEEKKFIKKIYAQKINDSLRVHMDFLEYYKDGEIQPEDELREEYEEKMERQKKGNRRDISTDITEPLKPDMRPLYDIEYKGLADTLINGYTCHIIRVDAREEADSLINCTYYIDTATFNVVRAEFEPADLPGGLMFSLKTMQMNINYAPVTDSLWLTRKFTLEGHGKAALFVGVHFEMEETYGGYAINRGIPDSIFIENQESE